MRISVDKAKCSGCRICQMTCSAVHLGEVNIYRAACDIGFGDTIPDTPRFCMQCKNAACVKACPTGALEQGEQMVVFHKDLCTRCALCVKSCKLSGIKTDFITGYPIKCDLCGGEPKCIIQCPAEALSLK